MTEHAGIERVEVAIVGGGMVGAALACALAQRGFRVALIEAREPQRSWEHGSYDIRVSAISHASQALFENLGVWRAMAEQRVTPYRAMQVWDAAGSGEIRFDAAELGEPDLGHIVENRVIQAALWQRLEQCEQVQLRCPASLVGWEMATDGGVQIDLQGYAPLEADLLVGADGAGSRVREMAGITVRGWDYDQTAVVATVRPTAGHFETAWQRFLPTGPLALLPLGVDLFSIVWSTSAAHAETLLLLDDDAFGAALTEASEGRVGEIKAFGPRGAFPLRLQHAREYVKPGVALIGDAAHVIHPLAGQGVNLGLLDAAVAVDVLTEARERGRRLGGFATLRRYERARKGDNLAVQFAMDGFKRLFASRWPPVHLLRNLGLTLADRIGPVKGLFAGAALGSGGELPSLSRRPR